MMDDWNSQVPNTTTTAAKSNACFIAVKDCRTSSFLPSLSSLSLLSRSWIDFRKAPSLVIPEGATIPKGTTFEIEQVIYTADGTWLRVSTATIKTILQDETTLSMGWVCAEPRGDDPNCIPSDTKLFQSLWNKGR